MTVRQRFLSTLDEQSIKSLEELNHRFWHWQEEDYHRKTHSSLGMSPLDFFMSQAHLVKMFPNPELLDDYFLLRVERKVKHDATISLNNVLYETDAKLTGQKLEVRYDPAWLDNPAKPILLFKEGNQVGTARQVNFHDNAYVKRAGGSSNQKEQQQNANDEDKKHEKTGKLPKAAISFNRIMKEEVDDDVLTVLRP